MLFVYDTKSKQVKMRDVKTGIQNNEFIQITSGLKKGDVVVVAPYGTVARTLQDNAKVRIVPRNQLYEAKKEE